MREIVEVVNCKVNGNENDSHHWFHVASDVVKARFKLSSAPPKRTFELS
jgi:hypothetical protein